MDAMRSRYLVEPPRGVYAACTTSTLEIQALWRALVLPIDDTLACGAKVLFRDAHAALTQREQASFGGLG